MSDIARRLLADDYRISGERAVAYIDESYSTPTQPGDSFYILTAVVVSAAARDALRDGIEQIAEGDWWHTTEVLRRSDGIDWVTQMLEYLRDGDEVSVVSLNESVADHDTDGEQARRTCFERVLPHLEQGVGIHGSVQLSVIERRRDKRQQDRDTYFYRQMIARGLLSDSFRIRQSSPSDEHLLWLPDTVCSAVRRKVTHRNEQLLKVVEPAIEWV